jgi:hypothetical protein
MLQPGILIDRLGSPDHLIQGEAFEEAYATGFPHPCPRSRILDQSCEAVHERGQIAARNQIARVALHDGFSNTTDIRGHHG